MGSLSRILSNMSSWLLLVLTACVLMGATQGAPDVDTGEEVQEPRYSCPEIEVAFRDYTIDVIHNVYSRHDCGAACSLNSECLFYTWYVLETDCLLKYSDIGFQKSPGAISGARG